ncbi:UNVERIFIED_CONTAM: hypothetical protein Sradi_1776800 [Sesamum radiatum]|uniref:Uncharacterized protein n=1 Tax=Sesamum radiatum TaxID=300843 RepID=A0AAW2TVD3_SESRA
MEKTFDGLIEHAKHDQFHYGRENRHAISCSLRDSNKQHSDWQLMTGPKNVSPCFTKGLRRLAPLFAEMTSCGTRHCASLQPKKNLCCYLLSYDYQQCLKGRCPWDKQDTTTLRHGLRRSTRPSSTCCITKRARATVSDESRPNEVALEFAVGAVNVFAGRDWDMDFYENKLRYLRLCYEAFQRILDDGHSHGRLIRTVCLVQNSTRKD